MSSVIIELKGIGKGYPHTAEPSRRFWELLTNRPSERDLTWVLRDITFTVERGSAVGLVGRNGAGKSTLLQIIAGTVAPTVGSARVTGRVAPLLELGAGFNLEFTGRENIGIAGALLGLTPRELKDRSGAIADFADIGEFIDRPVKTYSSGMFARLAFSVAVHMDPDILLVDEILSVGDIGFQQRCLGRLRELRERKVTLLFVSHGPDAIKSVCEKALFLHDGHLVAAGNADVIVDKYLAFIREQTNREQLASEENWPKAQITRNALPAKMRYGTGHVLFTRIELLDETGAPRRAFALGQMIVLEADVCSTFAIENLSLSFLVRDGTGVDLMGTTTFDRRISLPSLQPHRTLRVRFSFANVLRAGAYGISIAINRVARRDYTDNVLLDQLDGAISFASMEDPSCPVHYKVHQPIAVSYDEPFDTEHPRPA